MEITHVRLGERVIAVSIQRHMRARRISLRLSPARDGIIMTLPRRAALTSGMEFFTSKSSWILANLDSEASVSFNDGSIIPMLGKTYTIRRTPGRGVSTLNEETAELHIYGSAEFTPRRVKDFLKKHLQHYAFERATERARILGKNVSEVRLRDTRSRWGSCTAKGKLTFNWRLVFAEPEIVNYLIAHEVAHLVEMNHSERFWHVVATLCPEHQSARAWLKKEGHRLHRFG
jgi:predicted metal-dependent hydrolase